MWIAAVIHVGTKTSVPPSARRAALSKTPRSPCSLHIWTSMTIQLGSMTTPFGTLLTLSKVSAFPAGTLRVKARKPERAKTRSVSFDMGKCYYTLFTFFLSVCHAGLHQIHLHSFIKPGFVLACLDDLYSGDGRGSLPLGP